MSKGTHRQRTGRLAWQNLVWHMRESAGALQELAVTDPRDIDGLRRFAPSLEAWVRSEGTWLAHHTTVPPWGLPWWPAWRAAWAAAVDAGAAAVRAKAADDLAGYGEAAGRFVEDINEALRLFPDHDKLTA